MASSEKVAGTGRTISLIFAAFMLKAFEPKRFSNRQESGAYPWVLPQIDEVRMTIRLNDAAYAQAEDLIKRGHTIDDHAKPWTDVKPSVQEENEFIETHSFREYGDWHLGIEASKNPDTKARYSLPYGDFDWVRRSALLALQKNSRDHGERAITAAATDLLERLDAAYASIRKPDE